jgi:hypothetical protein
MLNVLGEGPPGLPAANQAGFAVGKWGVGHTRRNRGLVNQLVGYFS